MLSLPIRSSHGLRLPYPVLHTCASWTTQGLRRPSLSLSPCSSQIRRSYGDATLFRNKLNAESGPPQGFVPSAKETGTDYGGHARDSFSEQHEEVLKEDLKSSNMEDPPASATVTKRRRTPSPSAKRYAGPWTQRPSWTSDQPDFGGEEARHVFQALQAKFRVSRKDLLLRPVFEELTAMEDKWNPLAADMIAELDGLCEAAESSLEADSPLLKRLMEHADKVKQASVLRSVETQSVSKGLIRAMNAYGALESANVKIDDQLLHDVVDPLIGHHLQVAQIASNMDEISDITPIPEHTGDSEQQAGLAKWGITLSSQWRWLRASSPPLLRSQVKAAFDFWKTNLLHITKHKGSSSGFGEEGEVNRLLQLHGVKTIRTEWEKLDEETRANKWPQIMLSTIAQHPEQTSRMLQATLDPLPPGYAIADILQFVASTMNMKGLSPKAQANLSEHEFERFAAVIDRLPPGHVPIYQRTIGIYAQKLLPAHAKDLYDLVSWMGMSLHPHTQLHFASTFARDPSHKGSAFDILKRLAESGYRIDNPEYASVVTTLLHSKQAPESADTPQETSPRGILEYYMERNMKPNLVAFTAFIDSLCKQGETQEAIRLTVTLHENGVKLDDRAFNAVFRGAKQSQHAENVAEAYEIANLADVEEIEILNNSLHAVFYFADMESRERGASAPWVLPLFIPMLRLYSQRFKLETLQLMLPDILPLLLKSGANHERFGPADGTEWQFPRTIVPVVNDYFSKHDSLESPDTTTLSLMLRGYIKSLKTSYDLVAFYSFFKTQLEAPAEGNLARQIVEAEGSVIHDTFIMAMLERRGLARPALQVFGDMIRETSPATHDTSVHPAPSVFTFGILIHGLYKRGEAVLAGQIMQVMKEQGVHRNLVMWNTLTMAHASRQNVHRTVNTLQDLEAAGFKPDMYTYRAFGKLRRQDHALRLMESIINVNKRRMVETEL